MELNKKPFKGIENYGEKDFPVLPHFTIFKMYICKQNVAEEKYDY